MPLEIRHKLHEGNDAGIRPRCPRDERIAMRPTAFVVSAAQFFPGGNIGLLAVAEPSTTSRPRRQRALSCGFILEEGLSHG